MDTRTKTMINTTIGPELHNLIDRDLRDAGDASADQVTATFASFTPGTGTLTAIGDNLANSISIGRNAAGNLLVNGGAVPIVGGTPTVANTTLIQVFGLGGNDVLSLDESNGALPRANLFGGAGNDVLTGGSGADMLFGQADNDTLFGKGGADLLFGGSGDDVLTGGDADDQMFGEAGNDRMIWNPGDDSDLMEGGAGFDTAEVNGGNGAETFTITANGARVRFDRVDPAPFSIDIGTTEAIVLNANGGDDVVTAGNGLSALVQLTIDGGAGNDTITGGDGADVLLGGDGNDRITGGRGNDLGLLGAGDDRFVWNPGDGSDVVEGQAGADTLEFNGANVSERITIEANGGRTRLFRDVAAVAMDLNDVERIEFRALGGVDTIAIGDLAGTDTTEVAINLASVTGGTTGDAQPDSVIVHGRNTADAVEVQGNAGSVSVLGLPARVSLANAEGIDRLLIQTLGGDDQVNASTLVAGTVALTIDAGAGNDTVFGSRGADVLLGGDGNDVIDGRQGDDTALLGAGDDRFVWNPGDGSDVVEGQAGTDTLLFNGANVSENISISANGARARFFRDVANVTMDLNDVERIDFQALGGADTIVVGDMSGAAVDTVALNLAASGGAPDNQLDTVVVVGGAGAETIRIGVVGSETVVSGLAAQLRLTGQDASDRLQINAGAGADTIDASALPAGRFELSLNGGAGDDVIIGSAGNDLVNGGSGSDLGLLGGGDDTFVWNPGDGSDVVEGQAGVDTMLFNGANIAERISIGANGGRVLFTRDVAAITMDLNDTEQIDFNALGGADTITIDDLSGTDVSRIHIDLAGTLGGTSGDGAADTVVIRGTNGDDVTVLQGGNGSVVINGLAAQIVIDHFDAFDTIRFEALGGNDVVEGSGMPAEVQLVVDGGAGDDVLIGGAGNDVLDGGAGDDVLIGGPGIDTLLNGEINIPLTSGPALL